MRAASGKPQPMRSARSDAEDVARREVLCEVCGPAAEPAAFACEGDGAVAEEQVGAGDPQRHHDADRAFGEDGEAHGDVHAEAGEGGQSDVGDWWAVADLPGDRAAEVAAAARGDAGHKRSQAGGDAKDQERVGRGGACQHGEIQCAGQKATRDEAAAPVEQQAAQVIGEDDGSDAGECRGEPSRELAKRRRRCKPQACTNRAGSACRCGAGR